MEDPNHMASHVTAIYTTLVLILLYSLAYSNIQINGKKAAAQAEGAHLGFKNS
jgi:hypothetical protein